MATATRKTNWFAIWISVGVVVVLVGLVAVVAVLNSRATDPGPAPAASGINRETGAITFGKGPDKVSTYVDFMCPYCGQFEEAEGKTISGLVDDGSITLEVHPVTILDRLSQGTEYSSRAASAMYAVAEADPGNAYAFFRALYDNQPKEQTPGLTDDELISLAKDSGVKMTAKLEKAIKDHEYKSFAQSQELPEGATGTPTLLVNDQIVPVTYDAQKDIVANLTSR
ncbi:thioredoxin domain-containing protein [Microbacterium sp. KSW-18]|uniref:Thioredoxin domain-containing protein n=1 Tax=Microbacterium aquilitoris TaxID=3067307 RepID=A0ABU3GM28_9MICO|nr:thioredoxin domain-containing protein [Microbacterium sp. KSW-18]MDT3331757.1 thioredoxin domain-containing protein [Microbacterium sp. KSW-18]